MKITDMIISAVIKRGVLYEARNCDMEFIIPMAHLGEEKPQLENKIKIQFKAEHMTLKIEKGE